MNDPSTSRRNVAMLSLALVVLGTLAFLGIAAAGHPRVAAGIGLAIAVASVVLGLVGRAYTAARIALVCSMPLLVVAAGVTALTWHHAHFTDVAAWLRVRGEAHLHADRDRAAVADEEYRRAQALLIRSPEILAAALRQDGIAELAAVVAQDDPVAWLSARISVVALSDSEVIQVRMTDVSRGREAADAAKIVNAIVRAYLQAVQEPGRVRLLEEASS